MWPFSKKNQKSNRFLASTELHSHLLPGIDDGIKTVEEGLEVFKNFEKWGIKRVITTPHIMGDFYPNTPAIIMEKRAQMQEEIDKAGIAVELQAAAEYYLDESMLVKLKNNEPLLTFGDKYLLFETSYVNQPFYLLDAIFAMASAGYKPVLAHPERYAFLQDKIQLFDELVNRGVYMQLNMASISGYYGKDAKKLARYMINEGKVHFVGSDCHGPRHLPVIEEVLQDKWYRKLQQLPLLNASI